MFSFAEDMCVIVGRVYWQECTCGKHVGTTKSMWHVQLVSDVVATDMEQRERNNAITLHFSCPVLRWRPWLLWLLPRSWLWLLALSLFCSLFLFS
jgi:hypothetical protein